MCGILLFIVLKFLMGVDGDVNGEYNDVVFVGLNYKMGYCGMINCLLNFGEGMCYCLVGCVGVIGYLVGQLNYGLVYMFYMMNEVCIGVGVGVVVFGYIGYLYVFDYVCNCL